MKYETYNEESGVNEFHNEFENQITHISALNSLLTGEELVKEEISFIKDFKEVKDFLELPLNDPREADLKKLFAAALIKAEENGLLSELELSDKSPMAIASLVDESLTRLKISYQTGEGILDPIEAAEALIDRVAVRTISVVEKVIEKGVPLAVDGLCKMLIEAYPPAIAIVPLIKKAEKFVTEKAKQLAKKGIEQIAKSAKSAVRNLAENTKKVAQKVLDWLTV